MLVNCNRFGESVIGESVEDLSVGRWNTCWLVLGRLVGDALVGGSVVGGSVEHLSVGLWSVVGELVVSGRWVGGWWLVIGSL